MNGTLIKDSNGRRQFVILGAGAPHRGKIPAALREPRSGTSALQWQLGASGYSESETTFVAGYQAEKIRAHYPGITVVENSDWETTGSGASLLAADFIIGQDLLTCYSDILFRESAPSALAMVKADIVVAWDSAWRHRYAGRTNHDLERCEKVIVNGERAEQLGPDLPTDRADGEFVGLVWFSPFAVEQLDRLREFGPDKLRGRHLSEYIEYFRGSGLSVGAVDVAGDWAELNEPRDIAHFILGTKAETLSRLRGTIRHAVIQEQLAFTIAEWTGQRSKVLERVQARFAGQSLVVRSSALSEDGFHASNAGAYDSQLNVDSEVGVPTAIDQVIASYGEAAADDQVLIQPMVIGVEVSGVAFTRTLENGAPWYIINYEIGGDTRAITGGTSADHLTQTLRRNGRNVTKIDPRLEGLVAALREIEVLLGYDALDIEFAINGDGQVHIFQVRPLVVTQENNSSFDDEAFDQALESAHRRWRDLVPPPPQIPGDASPLFGVMPDWNPAEIIGTSPGELAVSLYRYLVMDEVWAVQRAEYGYRDVRPSPLLVSFAGQPYVDVRASFTSFLPASLSNALAGRLLNFYLDWLRARPELHDKVEFEVVPTCLAPGFEKWEQRLCKAGGFNDAEVADLRDGLRAITAQAFERLDADLGHIETLTLRFDALMANNRPLEPLERAQILLDDCRRLGTLPFAHLARSGFVAVTMLREAVACGVISDRAHESFLSTVKTVSHQLKADALETAEGRLAWSDFVARYGHLRPGTYDITSPRYDQDPDRFLRPLLEHVHEAESEAPRAGPWEAERAAFCKALGELGLPSEPKTVETFLRRAIEGREYAKFVFSRNLSSALEALAEVGETYGFERDQVANLPLGELLALHATERTEEAITNHLRLRAENEAEGRRLAVASKLPPLITDEADLDAFVIGSERPNFIGSGTVTADCFDLSAYTLHGATDLAGYIVMIPQADPGFDWLFSQGIAGLITLYGGANSHMAIRAAEFGLPAAIGVGERRYRDLAGASVLELSPGNGLLRVVR